MYSSEWILLRADSTAFYSPWRLPFSVHGVFLVRHYSSHGPPIKSASFASCRHLGKHLFPTSSRKNYSVHILLRYTAPGAFPIPCTEYSYSAITPATTGRGVLILPLAGTIQIIPGGGGGNLPGADSTAFYSPWRLSYSVHGVLLLRQLLQPWPAKGRASFCVLLAHLKTRVSCLWAISGTSRAWGLNMLSTKALVSTSLASLKG